MRDAVLVFGLFFDMQFLAVDQVPGYHNDISGLDQIGVGVVDSDPADGRHVPVRDYYSGAFKYHSNGVALDILYPDRLLAYAVSDRNSIGGVVCFFAHSLLSFINQLQFLLM